MDRYKGDLTDIIRATGVGGGGSSATEEWQFESNTIGSEDVRLDDFGDPFTHFRDPLLQEIHTGFGFQNSSSVNDHVVEQHNGNFGNANFHDDHEMTRKSSSPNIFSRMLQISPAAKLQAPPQDAVAPRLLTAAPTSPMLVPSNVVNNSNNIIINDNNNKNNMISSNICKGHVEISSPRNTALKRRKNQAKKVVCIPAPAPANSRPSTGEIVPSDLWAWRKYGQKPIKGSPYPRGYYRCSSSKGCLARKQVERSRTDPNMLVITYTAEHNHPWPTQRNALAGSTRSHHSKNTTKNNPHINISSAPIAPNPRVANESELDPNLVAIKEELENDNFEMDDPDFDEGYNPASHDGSEQPEDNFFTDFGEIDASPTGLMFGLEYWGRNSGGATTSERSGTAGFYGEAKRDS